MTHRLTTAPELMREARLVEPNGSRTDWAHNINDSFSHARPAVEWPTLPFHAEDMPHQRIGEPLVLKR